MQSFDENLASLPQLRVGRASPRANSSHHPLDTPELASSTVDNDEEESLLGSTTSIRTPKPQLSPRVLPVVQPLEQLPRSNKRRKYPRISKPVEVLKNRYDVVVIGSGYGGGVAASRMARGRQSVCLLELGKERQPGEYPETLKEASKELHISGDFATKHIGSTPVETGDPTGLYHLILGDGQNAFVANGLGGTSLLNANVFLEADKNTMALEDWPSEIRENPDCLEKYYDRARYMLQPQVYPEDFPRLAKLDTLQAQAKVLGYSDKFRRVEQTTWFKQDGLNNCGVRMKKSKLTGMDSIGVNDGSKSSTLVNYLADAWNWGAEIFTRCEVRFVKKHPVEGYLIFFAWHGEKRDKFKDILYKDLMWVHAKKLVFFGGGAIGTTEILLRSKEYGLEMNECIGRNMNSNGDLLAFGYNLDREVNGLARPNPDPKNPVGPTITGIIDCRDADKALDGFVIEEVVISEPFRDIMQNVLEVIPGRQKPKGFSPWAILAKIISSLKSRVGGQFNPDGSLEKTQTYLIMCHDNNQATLTLKHDRPNLNFRGVGRAEHVKELNEKLAKATQAFDGTFVNNPFYLLNSEQEITVHPIGGAFMSSTGKGIDGVTNHRGQILVGEDEECYPGLVVVDASVIPTALGANPFATITALAERSVELVAEEYGIEIDYDTKNQELDFCELPEKPIVRRVESISLEEESILSDIRENKDSLEFTKAMRGHINVDFDDEDIPFEQGERLASGRCEEARFFLSVHLYDVQTFLNGTEHKAKLTGTFTSGALPASPYMIVGADFRFFTVKQRTPDAENLIYDFDMTGTDGSVIHFHGYEVIEGNTAFNILGMRHATTTLMFTLSEALQEGETRSRVIGKGILRIQPRGLVAELQSLSSSLQSGMQFIGHFARSIARPFFAPFGQLQWPKPTLQAWSPRSRPSHVFNIIAQDGVESLMKMWDPLSTQAKHMDLLFIPGVAVDETIFAVPDIKENVIDYFRKRGYRCWSVTHRVGKSNNAKTGWTTYDARLDIAAAVDKIQELRQSSRYGQLSSKTYIVAHCAGALALASGLLSGDINTSSIAGITASQVFMTPQYAAWNSRKAAIPFATQAYALLAGSNWYDCTSECTDTYFQLALDQLLRFYPLARKDLCSSVVCHRASFIFGLLWSHQNLNARTHKHLHNYLGGISMACQEHLIAMGKSCKVLRDNGTDDLVTEANIERLRGIPILFLAGTENSVYDPENTKVSFDKLQRTLDTGDYERELLAGFGHLDTWMSDRSAEEVFYHVENHLDKMIERMKIRELGAFAKLYHGDTKARSPASPQLQGYSPHQNASVVERATSLYIKDTNDSASAPPNQPNTTTPNARLHTFEQQNGPSEYQLASQRTGTNSDSPMKLLRVVHELCSYLNEDNQQIAPLQHTIHFQFRFDVAFLLEGRNSVDEEHQGILQNLLTLSSDGHNIQALTCSQYLQYAWPGRKHDSLSLLTQIARKGQGMLITEKCVIEGWITESMICFSVTGSAESISEVGAEFMWLGATLRSPPAQKSIYYCSPTISIQEGPLCIVDYAVEVMTVTQEPGHCWQSMFQSVIVAQEFPVTARMSLLHGLEMELSVMMALSNTCHIGKMDDCIVIRGVSSLFTLSERQPGYCCWHFEGEIGGRYVPRIKNKLKLNGSKFQHLGVHEILNDRHFVGWCKQVKYGAGALDSDFCITRSGLNRALGSLPTFDKRLYRGQRYTQEPVYVATPRGFSRLCNEQSLVERLDWLCVQTVVLWDAPEQRGWLTNGTSALLHLVYTSLKKDEKDEDKTEYFCFDWSKLRRPAVHKANSAKRILADIKNLDLQMISHGNCSILLRERIEDLFFLLEAITDQQYNPSQSTTRVTTALHGWEFMELVNTGRNPLYPRAFDIDEGCRGWMNLVCDISAITLFGRGFGEIFQPKNYSKACSHWTRLPLGNCYLAASVWDLKKIMEDYGSEPVKLSDNTIWPALPSTFEPCECTISQEHRNLVQLLIPSGERKVLTADPSPQYQVPEDGAVVFGAVQDACWPKDNELVLEEHMTIPPVAKKSSSTTLSLESSVDDNSAASSWGCNDYSVAIICALPKEFKAVRLLFDKLHPPPPKLDGHDPNVYAFGRMGKHNIVAACLPKGEYGNCSATDVSSHLRRSFLKIEIFLLVGIGGGIPSADNDIRLGDVVVSVPCNGSPGIIKYDFRRVRQNDKAQALGCLYPPPQRLLAVISHLQSNISCESNDLQSYMSRIIAVDPAYGCPGSGLDRLYQARYTHVEVDNEACLRCIGPIIARPTRIANQPNVHFGIVASGDQVIRDAILRDQLGSQHGALCFDMEAGGVASKLSCIVVRGICDYSDSHKSKIWQKYAAASAASYTKLLLCNMRSITGD